MHLDTYGHISGSLGLWEMTIGVGSSLAFLQLYPSYMHYSPPRRLMTVASLKSHTALGVVKRHASRPLRAPRAAAVPTAAAAGPRLLDAAGGEDSSGADSSGAW